MKSFILLTFILVHQLTFGGGHRVVVLGGGGGGSQTLKALVPYLGRGIDHLAGVITNADDGGSTGKLRELYNSSAVGDLSKTLLGLSTLPEDVKNMLNMRMPQTPLDEKNIMSGHSLKNILLAVPEVHENIESAIGHMKILLKVPEQTDLIPISKKAGEVLYQKNGLEVKGQYNISLHKFQSAQDDLQHDPTQDHLKLVNLTPEDFHPTAKKYILNADYIILAPGNVYATILPLLATPGLKEILMAAPGKLIYSMPMFNNLKYGQTVGWDIIRHKEVYDSYIGKTADIILANDGRPNEMPENYELVDASLSNEKLPSHILYFKENLLSKSIAKKQANDVIVRSPIVHGASVYGEILMSKIIKAD